MKFESRLLKKVEIAEKTFSYCFEKPISFVHHPGQYITVTLLENPIVSMNDSKRDFSIVSAPHETYIELAMRHSDSDFKRSLNKLALGEEVKIDGPFGSFVLVESRVRPVVVIAGGIGITPFISMIRHVVHKKIPLSITVFCTNHKSEHFAYLDELRRIEIKNKNIKIVPMITGSNKEKDLWNGERGYVNESMIMKYISDPHTTTFYSAGPPGMVSATWQMLIKMGIPEENIKTEEFAGYK